MARKRMIDPEFFLNEKLASIKAHSRLLYIGLWGLADDNYATLPNRPEWIKAQIFPYEDVDIKVHLKELEKIGDIVKFEFEGAEYWYIPSFFTYQRVEKPSKAKYPKYDTIPQPLPNHSPNTPAEVKLSKEKLREVKDKDVAKEETPLQKVVNHYKVKTKYKKEDKAWDRTHYPRCSKSAKKLIDFCGSPELAIACIDGVAAEMVSKKLDWTIETIVKHSAKWKLEYEEKHEQALKKQEETARAERMAQTMGA